MSILIKHLDAVFPTKPDIYNIAIASAVYNTKLKTRALAEIHDKNEHLLHFEL